MTNISVIILQKNEALHIKRCLEKLDTRNRELHVLYLGRRHPLKGVEFLEAAVMQLQNSTRSTRSPMRTFVNMQNRFGDFRSNPGCLM